MKPTPMRVLRAFRWQRAFERLMQEREDLTTLKDMASLINDIARIESDIFRPVTEEELKALENDPMHGMTDVAMMYVYFMRASSTIHRNNRNLGSFNDPDWKSMVEYLGVHRGDDFQKKMDVFDGYEDGSLLLTGINVSFVDGRGVKRWVSLSSAAIEDADARELMEMLKSSVKSVVWKKARKSNAYSKRRKMFKALAEDKITLRKLRDGLLGKSVNEDE